MKKHCWVMLNNDEIRFRCNGETSVLALSDGPKNWAAIGDSLDRLMRDSGYRNEKLILGLASTHVFFVPTEFDRTTAQSISAVKFALEEHLPIDAEDMVPLVTHVPPAQHTVVLDVQSIKELLVYLHEQYSHVFDIVAPTSLLIAEHLLQTKAVPSECQLFIQGQQSDAFRFEGNAIAEWRYVKGNKIQFPSGSLEDDLPKLIVLLDAANNEGVFIPESAQVLDDNFSDVLNSLNSRIESGEHSTNYNFSESMNSSLGITQIDNSALSLLCGSILFTLLCLAAVFGYRAYGWNQQAANMDQTIRQQFREVLPDRRINGPVERLLESELKMQQASNELISHANKSARVLVNLESFLASLPNSVRFQFDSIDIFPDGVSVSGEVKSPADLEILKTALTNGGFEIGTGSTFSKKFTLILERDSETSLP